jgi:hypothetical protein
MPFALLFSFLQIGLQIAELGWKKWLRVARLRPPERAAKTATQLAIDAASPRVAFNLLGGRLLTM